MELPATIDKDKPTKTLQRIAHNMGDSTSCLSSSKDDRAVETSTKSGGHESEARIDQEKSESDSRGAKLSAVFATSAPSAAEPASTKQHIVLDRAVSSSLQTVEADLVAAVAPSTVGERVLPKGGVPLSEIKKLAPIGPDAVGQDDIKPTDVILLDDNLPRNKEPAVDFFGRPRPKSLVRKWPTTLMYLMSQATDDVWQDVMDRIESHPNEIGIQGINGGMNSLHAACVRYPPLHIVQAILGKNPTVALQRNFNGENPLHIATYSSSEEVQSLIIRTVPAAATMMDQYGDSPLHFSARVGATYNLMEAIVAAAPSMISQPNKRGVTPFWMLPRTFLETNDLEDVIDVDGEDYRDDWDNLVLFLRYSYFPEGKLKNVAAVRDGDGRPLPIQRDDYLWVVHAAAATPSCPREVLKWLCRMFPEQALRFDHNGFTPLLLAVQQKELREPRNWNELEDGIRENVEMAEGELQNEQDRLEEDEAALNAGDSAFLEQIFHRRRDDEELRNSVCNFDAVEESVVEVLLEWSPRSALQEDADGRLPLTHALLSGMEWKTSISKLIASCPRALECRDGKTGLYNFQLAAMCSPQLDTVYTLVRSLPQLLASGNYGPLPAVPAPAIVREPAKLSEGGYGEATNKRPQKRENKDDCKMNIDDSPFAKKPRL